MKNYYQKKITRTSVIFTKLNTFFYYSKKKYIETDNLYLNIVKNLFRNIRSILG